MAKTPFKNRQLSELPANNLLINGAFDFWQRGTTAAGGDIYLADRFYTGNTLATSPVTSRSTDIPANSTATYSFSHTGTPTAAGQRIHVSHRIESVNAAALANKTVTFSFKYKGLLPNLNLTPANTGVTLYSPSTLDNFNSAAQTVNLGLGNMVFDNTWRTVTFTTDLTSITSIKNGLSVYIRFEPLGATTAWSFLTTEWTLTETSSSSGSFRRAGRNIQQELAMCQRYYKQLDDFNIARVILLQCTSTTSAFGPIYFGGSTMRTTPAVSISRRDGTALANSDMRTCISTGGGIDTLTRVITALSHNSFQLTVTTAASLTAGDASMLFLNGDSAFKLDSELN